MVQVGALNCGRIRRNGDRFTMSSGTTPFAMAPLGVLDEAIMSVCSDFVDNAILDLSFEIHRSLKLGYFMLDAGIAEEDEQFTQVNAEGVDVFGQTPVKKQLECICPNCSRNLAASRFAPHLEKCMGMGRNSSRIASRRIQNSSRESNTHLMEGPFSDDEDDEDWCMDRKRRKRDKNSPRRSKNAKICGVVSELTGKTCARSTRCTLHTIEQRRAARDQPTSIAAEVLLPNVASSQNSDSGNSHANKFPAINIDGLQQSVTDNDSMEMEACHMTSNWEHDLSNATSPADSTSTNNSSSTTATNSSSSSTCVTTKRTSSGKSKKRSKHSSSRKEGGGGGHHHHRNFSVILE